MGRERLAGVLAFTTIIFQHFQVATVSGYPVTIGLFTGTLLVALLVRRPPYGTITIAWTVLLVLAGLAALAANITDVGEWSATLALFLLSSLIIATATGSIRTEVITSRAFAVGLFAALLVVVAVSVGQTLLGLAGSGALFNLFGGNQYLHPYDPGLGFVRVPRAQGFFLEPSYDAFVIGSVGVALLALGHRSKSTILLVLAGMVASQSATGLLVLAAIVAISALRSRPRLALAAIVAGALSWPLVGSYLLQRLGSITESGTSANYRLVAPLEVLADVLRQSPLGKPLGSITDVISAYDLRMAGVHATSLDNGLYVIVFYFGWVGIVLLAAWLVYTIARTLRSPGAIPTYRLVAPLWLFATIFFSGAVMAPEYALMTWIVIACYRHAASQRISAPGITQNSTTPEPQSLGENHEPARTATTASRVGAPAAQYRDGDLPGRGGPHEDPRLAR